MAVKTVYIVERKGIETLRTDDKRKADAYDKMLDVSDEIYNLISTSGLNLKESDLEDLSVFLAKNKETTQKILKGQKFIKSEEKSEEKHEEKD